MKSTKVQLLVTLVAVLVAVGLFADMGFLLTENLFQAAYDDDLKAVRRLLSWGADINVKGFLDRTPLHVAARSDRKDMAELLISRGAKVDARDWFGNTPLLNAASLGRKDVAELLITHGADVNARGFGSRTPLHMTAATNILTGPAFKSKTRTAIIINENGRQVLTDAPRQDMSNEDLSDVAELLIAHGADANAKDVDGKTPLKLAVEDGNHEMAALLRQHGAKE